MCAGLLLQMWLRLMHHGLDQYLLRSKEAQFMEKRRGCGPWPEEAQFVKWRRAKKAQKAQQAKEIKEL